MMNFTSQICTTEEQSKRLLALGLKKETADCVVSSIGSKDRIIHTEEPIYVMESLSSKRIPNYPAWSFHRLLELCNVFYLGHRDYDSLINYLENLIKEGYFNKEYLN